MDSICDIETKYFNYVEEISGLSKEEIKQKQSPDFNYNETFPFISNQIHPTVKTPVYNSQIAVDKSISQLVYLLNKDIPLTTNSCQHTTYGWVHIHCNWINFYKWWHHINLISNKKNISNGLSQYLNFDHEIKNQRELIKVSMGVEPKVYFELTRSDVNKMVGMLEDLYEDNNETNINSKSDSKL